jgi:hypothetical protein
MGSSDKRISLGMTGQAAAISHRTRERLFVQPNSQFDIMYGTKLRNSLLLTLLVGMSAVAVGAAFQYSANLSVFPMVKIMNRAESPAHFYFKWKGIRDFYITDPSVPPTRIEEYKPTNYSFYRCRKFPSSTRPTASQCAGSRDCNPYVVYGITFRYI